MVKLLIGKDAPLFTTNAIVDDEFKKVSLVDYRGKYVVLLFYPQNMSYLCPSEVTQFSDRIADFTESGCVVLPISTESPPCTYAAIHKPRSEMGLGHVNVPMLSDATHAISDEYGVYKAPGGVAFRASFIVDGKGIVRHQSINDFPVARNADETLRLVRAFQYTDKYGEVCPAGWQPGAKTMVADTKQSKKYFEQQA